MLTREQILAADVRRTKTLPVPEWGGDVFIREMSLADKAGAYAVLAEAKGEVKTSADRLLDWNAQMIIRGIVDGDGKPLFVQTDADAIGKWPDGLVGRLVSEIEKFNAVTPDDMKALEKN